MSGTHGWIATAPSAATRWSPSRWSPSRWSPSRRSPSRTRRRRIAAPLDAIGRLAQYVLVLRIAAAGLTLVLLLALPQRAAVLLVAALVIIAMNAAALHAWGTLTGPYRLADRSHYLVLDACLALTVLAIVGSGTPLVLYLVGTGLLGGLAFRTRPTLVVSSLMSAGYLVVTVAQLGYVPPTDDIQSTVTLPALLLCSGGASVMVRRLIRDQERTAADLAVLRQEAAVRDERLRVSRDLHDGVVKNLHGIWLLSRSLGASAERGDSATVRQIAEVIAETAQASTAATRRMISGLRDLEGRQPLAQALEQLCSRTLADPDGRPRPRLELRLDGDAEVPEPARQELLAVAGEALRNVVRHAGAARVRVGLLRRDGQVCLEVDDDGCGFDPAVASTSPRRGHFGLIGMQERAALAGGSVDVASAPGAGSRVRFVVPLHPAPERAAAERMHRSV